MSQFAPDPILSHEPLLDPESGTPNRALLLHMLSPMLALGRRNARALAVLHVQVTDFLRSPGMLGSVATAIEHTVREGDIVARVGPDSFAVGLLEVWEPDAAVRVARRLLQSLESGLDDRGTPPVRIGVAFFPHDAVDGHTLLAAAEHALPVSGALGFADRELGREALRRAGLLDALTDAETISQFRLHYQPIRAVEGRAVVGAEALLRWNRSGALLPAGDFIGLAHTSGRIRAIERWSMERAMRDLRGWRQSGWDGWMSINLSGKSLEDPALPETVAQLFETTGAPADGVVFEITERSALSGAGNATAALEALRSQGVRIAVDDFGTGYASFEYLCNFDPDVVKLDRAFTVESDQPGSERLLPMLVGMAHQMGKPVVVEGVEQPTEWDRVTASRCEFVQGYFTGRPVSHSAFGHQHIAMTAA